MKLQANIWTATMKKFWGSKHLKISPVQESEVSIKEIAGFKMRNRRKILVKKTFHHTQSLPPDYTIYHVKHVLVKISVCMDFQ